MQTVASRFQNCMNSIRIDSRKRDSDIRKKLLPNLMLPNFFLTQMGGGTNLLNSFQLILENRILYVILYVPPIQ